MAACSAKVPTGSRPRLYWGSADDDRFDHHGPGAGRRHCRFCCRCVVAEGSGGWSVSSPRRPAAPDTTAALANRIRPRAKTLRVVVPACSVRYIRSEPAMLDVRNRPSQRLLEQDQRRVGLHAAAIGVNGICGKGSNDDHDQALRVHPLSHRLLCVIQWVRRTAGLFRRSALFRIHAHRSGNAHAHGERLADRERRRDRIGWRRRAAGGRFRCRP